MKQVKELRKEMIYGIAAWCILMSVILMVAAVFIQVNPWSLAAGVLAGGGTAVGLLFHMYHHLDIALDLKPDRAGRHTQFAAMQRMIIMAVVMAVSFLFAGQLHPAGVVFGIMGMKMSALFYPKIHKFFEHRRST